MMATPLIGGAFNAGHRTTLAGVKLVKSNVYTDERGFFIESFHRHKFVEKGLPASFMQDNHSMSKKTLDDQGAPLSVEPASSNKTSSGYQRLSL